MITTQFPSDDTEFTDYTISKVESEPTGGWAVHFDGWTFWIRKDSPIVPAVGMHLRQYGKSGYAVRGCFLDGVRLFYRTAEEERLRHEQWERDQKREKREAFERDREKIDARYDALPECFRRRLDKFRTNNPEFRYEYEGYELFCCEQAVEIAKALKSEDAVRAFYNKPWEEQRALVPTLNDGHSGNTFGCACSLAIDYLTDESRVVKRHGALAPLVGSEEYGCVPASTPAPEAP